MTMPTTLSSAQAASYARDGFLSPLAALTREQAADYRGKLEAFEQAVGGPLTFDAFWHLALEPAPAADLDEPARAACARSYDGYRAAYAEQVALEGR
jgi:hypothetical protein